MKTIYDEVLEILLDSFKDPQDEDNDCYMFNRRQMIKISKTIRKAQKQEKLLARLEEENKVLFNYIAEVYEELDSLMARLQDDYNNGIEFEQNKITYMCLDNIIAKYVTFRKDFVK